MRDRAPFSTKSFDELSRESVERALADRSRPADGVGRAPGDVRTRKGPEPKRDGVLKRTVHDLLLRGRANWRVAAGAIGCALCVAFLAFSAVTLVSTLSSSAPRTLEIEDYGAGQRLRSYSVAVQNRDGDVRVYVATPAEISGLTIILETDSHDVVTAQDAEFDGGLWSADITLSREQLSAAEHISLTADRPLDSNAVDSAYSELRRELIESW